VVQVALVTHANPKAFGKKSRSATALTETLKKYDVHTETVKVGDRTIKVDPRLLLMLSKTGVTKRATPKDGEEEEEEEEEENEEEEEEKEPEDEPIPLVLDEVPDDDEDEEELARGRPAAPHLPAWLDALIQKSGGMLQYMGSTPRNGVQHHKPPAEMQRHFAGVTPITVNETLSPVLGELGHFLDDSPFLNTELRVRTESCLTKGTPLSLLHHRFVEDAIVARRSPTFLFELAYARELQRRDIVVRATDVHAALYELVGSPQAAEQGTLLLLNRVAEALYMDRVTKLLKAYWSLPADDKQPLKLDTVMSREGKFEHMIIWLLINAYRVGASVVDAEVGGSVLRPLLLVDPPGVQTGGEPHVHWVILRTGPSAQSGTLWRKPAGTSQRQPEGNNTTDLAPGWGHKALAMVDEPLEGKSDAVIENRCERIFGRFIKAWTRECRF
jgi:hypothetical protein